MNIGCVMLWSIQLPSTSLTCSPLTCLPPPLLLHTPLTLVTTQLWASSLLLWTQYGPSGVPLVEGGGMVLAGKEEKREETKHSAINHLKVSVDHVGINKGFPHRVVLWHNPNLLCQNFFDVVNVNYLSPNGEKNTHQFT